MEQTASCGADEKEGDDRADPGGLRLSVATSRPTLGATVGYYVKLAKLTRDKVLLTGSLDVPPRSAAGIATCAMWSPRSAYTVRGNIRMRMGRLAQDCTFVHASLPVWRVFELNRC